MDFTGFFHEPNSRFAYPVDVNTLHIRLRTGQNAATSVTLAIFDTFNWVEQQDEPGKYVFDMDNCAFIPMEKEYGAKGFDWYFACADVPTKRAKYAFIVENENERYFYGQNGALTFVKNKGIGEITHLCFMYGYILEEDIFRAPEWAKEARWYQIFPERFENSGESGLQKGELTPWDSMSEADNSRFYGGDLHGVISRLDYIRDMGFTGIYFTPLFTSPSVHKYNTEDYYQIDPSFGDDAVFGKLVEESHKRGIRIMLDLVFNHIGETHPFWRDVLENGRKSRYFNCFHIKGFDEKTGEIDYETFGNSRYMPKWNVSDPFARKYLLDVAAYWARKYNIDAYRLDVANEVPHGFWRDFRKTVRGINPDIYIVGEVWDRAMAWLDGSQFDSVMNYPLAAAVWDFAAGRTDCAGLKEALSDCLSYYPKNRQAVMFNIIGTHDTGRVLTIANGRTERALQAFILLYTSAGCPCVLYGDEVGLTGGGMDSARKCMEWDLSKQNLVLKDAVKLLNTLRATHPAMRAADINFVSADEESLVFTKRGGDEEIAVLLNGADRSIDIALPEAWTGRKYMDLLTGRVFTLNKAATLPPYGVGLWKLVKYIDFPPTEYAESNGLLAIGGDLSTERLLDAYSKGIFPWYNPGEVIKWWCPNERFVIFPSDVHISRSMRKVMKKTLLETRFNVDFESIIRFCKILRANETWITDEMEAAYTRLFQLGHAMCAGVYSDERLVGGLYGVVIGKCFFGESMFTLVPNASKLALIQLCQKLSAQGFLFADCQFRTTHLESMGGQCISWETYKRLLAEGVGVAATSPL